jgi:uncharacterized membrane protein YkvA (DUF1232 family)
MTTKRLHTWKRRANRLKVDTYTIFLVYKDSRVPWYAKILIACTIGYAFSPVDKFLNSIPIIGYLDHLILVPLGVVLAFKKMIPSAVWADCREIATYRKKSTNWADGSIIAFILLLVVSLVIISTTWAMKDWDLVITQWFKWFTRMALASESNVR